MELVIRKAEVYKEVEKLTSQVAAALQGQEGVDFDSWLATEYEGGILDTYWIETCGSVIRLLSPFLSTETKQHKLQAYDSQDIFFIQVNMPQRFNQLLVGSICDNLKMLLAQNVAAGWLANKNAELAERFAKNALSELADFRAKLFFRQEPVNSFFPKEDENFKFKQYEKCCSRNNSQQGCDIE